MILGQGLSQLYNACLCILIMKDHWSTHLSCNDLLLSLKFKGIEAFPLFLFPLDLKIEDSIWSEIKDDPYWIKSIKKMQHKGKEEANNADNRTFTNGEHDLPPQKLKMRKKKWRAWSC